MPLEQISSLADVVSLCERFSHALRSPLSVCMGVIADMEQGYSLDSQDIADARTSLEQILSLIDRLRLVPQFFEDEQQRVLGTGQAQFPWVEIVDSRNVEGHLLLRWREKK
ncbi:MAG: hypothetical protein KDD44_10525 [Bdellovibrionales bacterium]|nr:hypothetical protein [Bdellovibrionales bacterium]